MAIVLQHSLFDGEFVPFCTECQKWADHQMSRSGAMIWANSHRCEKEEIQGKLWSIVGHADTSYESGSSSE
jgi:hypothetical protein